MTRAAAIAALLATAPTAAGADTFDDLLWQARPVVVFAADASDTRVSEQVALLTADAGAVEERDIVILEVWPDRVEMDSHPVAAAPADLYRRFRVEPGRFSVLLVGKDGGVKRRLDSVIAPGALFDQIDSMPMRRQEMRRTN